ncbi:MAG: tetratricopeptide repeat protein [Kiritimatiellae bacterium]|nr:tetratricopeptide repeat protein [Kiritimatiellia bacterium]
MSKLPSIHSRFPATATDLPPVSRLSRLALLPVFLLSMTAMVATAQELAGEPAQPSPDADSSPSPPAPPPVPDPLSVEASDLLLTRGRAALEDNLLDIAETNLAQVAAKSIDRRRRTEATVWLARTWLAAGRPEDALAAIDGMDPTTLKDAQLRSKAACVRAEILARLARTDEALAVIEALPSPPEHTLAWAARLATEATNFDAALALYARIPTNSPELPPATFALASALDAAGRPDEAAPLWTALESPETPAVWRERADWTRLQKSLNAGEPTALAEVERWAAVPSRTPELARLAWHRLAIEAAAKQRYADAQLYASRAAANAADAPQRLQDRLLLAQIELKAGALAEATAAMRSLATDIPLPDEAAAVQRELATALLAAGAYDDALAEAQHWLDAFEGRDGTRDLRVVQAEALSHLGRNAEAAKAWQRMMGAPHDDADTSDSDLLRRAADALFSAHQLDDAQTAYEKVLALVGPRSPDGYAIRLQLAEVALALHPEESKGELILQELSREPDAGKTAWIAALRLGRLYEERGADALAETQYGQIADAPTASAATPPASPSPAAPGASADATTSPPALAPAPTPSAPPPSLRAEALLARGLVRHRLGDENGALDDFSRLLADHPASPGAPQARYMCAWCYHALGRVDDAQAAAEALLADPAAAAWAPRTRFLLAEQAFNAGDFPTATNQFARIAADAPDSPLAPDALYWAARACAAMDDYLYAERHLDALVAAYPDHPRIADALLAQGDVLCRLGNFSAAIAAYTEVINSFPRTPQAIAAWGRKGDAQFTLGQDDPARYEEALLSYRTLREYAAVPPDFRLQADYKIGRCLEKTGHHSDAIAQYMSTAYDYLQQTAPAPESAVWFTRSAFAAAALQEAAGNWREALGIYRRVADAHVAAEPEALDRIRRIRDDHWYQLPSPAP